MRLQLGGGVNFYINNFDLPQTYTVYSITYIKRIVICLDFDPG